MKKSHKYLGLLMLLPFIAWAITGVFFFIKPGYKSAYENLTVKTYPLQKIERLEFQNAKEIRLLRSILGNHLLVKKENQWQQLNPLTFEEVNTPNKLQVESLINDAIQVNPDRYGHITRINGNEIIMSTGVTINLNWPEMRLYQSGSDTDFINWMYKVHYLQWTGVQSIDKVLGIVGLGLVIILAFLGVLMSFKGNQSLKGSPE